jgi:hypothetical protein
MRFNSHAYGLCPQEPSNLRISDFVKFANSRGGHGETD